MDSFIIDVVVNGSDQWWQGYFYGALTAIGVGILFVGFTYLLSAFDKK